MQPWQSWDRGICGLSLLLFAGLFLNGCKNEQAIICSAAISPYRLQPHFLDASNFACHSDPRPSLAPGRPPVLAALKNLCIKFISPAEGISQTWCDPWGAGALCNRRALSID